MKILFLMDSLNLGGAEIWALDVCRNAQAAGIDLVFAAMGGGALEDEFRSSGVEFVRLERKLPIDPRVIREIRKLVRERGITIIHSNQAVDGLHARLATVGLDVKHVLHFHGHIPHAKDLWASRLLHYLTDLNVVATEAFAKLLAADLKIDADSRTRVLPCGIDIKWLGGGAPQIRAELGLPRDGILFGMVANYYAAERKDQLTVCRALPRVFDAVPDARFVFVYSQVEEGAVKKLEACIEYCRSNGIADRVHFVTGRFSGVDVIRELDVFVFSTLHESFGIAAVEAWLLEKPCILSDIDVLVEISDGGRFASVFKTGDAEDLAAKMIELGSSSEMRRELAARSRQFALEKYSIEANLRTLRELYESISRPTH